MISSYAANIEDINNILQKDATYEALSGMPRALTLGSFQGQENDIAIVIMGTAPEHGPGLTADDNRLNVLLTRQRCGLIIVGNINGAGLLLDGQGRTLERDPRAPTSFICKDLGGRMRKVKAVAIRKLHDRLLRTRRVAIKFAGPS